MTFDLSNKAWKINPFPHIVIDNFLSKKEFEKLSEELNSTETKLQRKFSTVLEDKEIHKDTTLSTNAKKLIKIMTSDRLKTFISFQFDSLKVLSLGETDNYSGYSPFHTTYSQGHLGSHIDHSCINDGEQLHIANAIYYASSEWEKEWGGETILFSGNGLFPKVKIDPIPNRLIIFIHSANSWHGVSKYNPKRKITRKTFYHDYYINKKYKSLFLDSINKKRKNKLRFSTHGTTFIPFFPNGLNKICMKEVLNKSNFKYIKVYLLYQYNKFFNTDHRSIRSIFIKT